MIARRVRTHTGDDLQGRCHMVQWDELVAGLENLPERIGLT
jgi:hypothetical protein